MANYADMKVTELKSTLKSLGLSTIGKKADLVERLVIYQQQGTQPLRPAVINKRTLDGTQQVISKKMKVDVEAIKSMINGVFDKYEDIEDEINDNGIVAFCADLDIDPQDPVVLVLSWYMEAKNMCTYTRTEFERGFFQLGCKSIDDMKKMIPKMRKDLEDDSTFTKVYSYVYDFGKDSDQKSMTLDIALALWQLLLPSTRFPLLTSWVSFVQTSSLKVVSKDVWMQLLQFLRTIRGDLSNFDEDGAWPVILDDFVAALKKR